MFKRSLTIAAFGMYILAAGLGACAGPNQPELQSYRVLVPDWSKTSGGYSPALSPDGKTLAYLSQGKVWIISNLDQYGLPGEGSDTPPSMPEPWALDVKIPDTDTKSVKLAPDRSAQANMMSPGARNVDWSPDGKRLTFIYQGRLFIAEGFDFKAKTAKSRMVADVTVAKYEGKPTGEWLLSPRWSPGGTKIAFVRPPDALPAPGYRVSVLDVKTGRETVVAQNGFGVGIWGQPWSPDSGSLVYAHSESSSDKAPKTTALSPQGISTVRIDEGKPVKIAETHLALSPSWSPRGDKLAWSAPPDGQGFTIFLHSTLVSDPDGSNLRPVALYMPSEEAVDAAMADARRRLQEMMREIRRCVHG